ncbi:MAG: DUF2914 domain-containing protein [Methylobacter sp.]|uniref:DUF2914 domain-containing protein n=1 Tax=Candidatus Methylobacter titanis TaxID=3053457 RepID=A0AA43TLQ4_9GAMM|nr:DUF2914 domain-containing protein [Candidatus Methylobacter titanis]
MTDKRNIVIQVKYPISGKAAVDLAPKMITEWNIKRILLAASMLVLILVSLFYIINKDTQNIDPDNIAMIVNATEKQLAPQVGFNEAETKNLDISTQGIAKNNLLAKSSKEPNKSSQQAAEIPVKKIIKEQPNKKVIKELESSKVNTNEVRAVLTYEINNKEPVGEIVKTINISKKKPIWVYYFTELKEMKGSKVYHEWLKDGVVDTRRALIISGNRWRTSSRKLFSDAEKGNWTVRLFDKNDRLLNEKNFKVE